MSVTQRISTRVFAITAGVALLALAALPLRADEGVLEINDACAQAGCFGGDGPGYPVFIGQPGSFRLTSNLYPNGANGIEITAGTKIVTIDLNGFRIDGQGVGQGGGIIGGTGASAIVIRNGTITAMGGDGINIGGSAVVESVHVLGSGGDGIDVNQTSMVRDCRVVGNGGYGLDFSDASSIYSGMVLAANGAGSVNLGRGGGPNYCDDDRCNRWGRRRFYLTTSLVPGSLALSACSTGFHMASLFEIIDPSNLQYDTHLGVTSADSGSGPPNYVSASVPSGWIRTGGDLAGLAGTDLYAGRPNCLGWSSDRDIDDGTTAHLPLDWRITAEDDGSLSFPQQWPNNYVAHQRAGLTRIPPYAGFVLGCDSLERVWCVED